MRSSDVKRMLSRGKWLSRTGSLKRIVCEKAIADAVAMKDNTQKRRAIQEDMIVRYSQRLREAYAACGLADMMTYRPERVPPILRLVGSQLEVEFVVRYEPGDWWRLDADQLRRSERMGLFGEKRLLLAKGLLFEIAEAEASRRSGVASDKPRPDTESHKPLTINVRKGN